MFKLKIQIKRTASWMKTGLVQRYIHVVDGFFNGVKQSVIDALHIVTLALHQP